MHHEYEIEELTALRDHLLDTADREELRRYCERTSGLLDEIEPEQDYTYSYIYGRITGNVVDDHVAPLIGGAIAQRDLRQFVDDLSEHRQTDSTP